MPWLAYSVIMDPRTAASAAYSLQSAPLPSQEASRLFGHEGSQPVPSTTELKRYNEAASKRADAVGHAQGDFDHGSLDTK